MKQAELKYFKHGNIEENEELEYWDILRQEVATIKAKVTYLALDVRN